MRPILWFLITLPALPAVAGETCKYVDSEGRITFANVPVKNARRVMCFDPVPAPRSAPKQAAPAARPDTAAAPAKIDTDTQRRRDTDRKRILEQELSDEQRLLEQALRTLQDSHGAPSKEGTIGSLVERARPALDAVARHERNIEAIRRELSAVR